MTAPLPPPGSVWAILPTADATSVWLAREDPAMDTAGIGSGLVSIETCASV